MRPEDMLRPLSGSERAALKKAVTRWSAQLTEGAGEYLAARGIGEIAALTHLVGVVDGEDPTYRKYTGMLSIPYLDRKGDPLAVRFRCLQDHNHRDFGHGKYTQPAGQPTRMYNITQIFKATDTIGVTEGEMDSIVLSECGIPAVAIPGANNWKPHHKRMLAGFSKIYVCGDPDEAGNEFNRAVTKALPRASVVPLKDGDVTDYWQAGGADAIHKLFKEAGK